MYKAILSLKFNIRPFLLKLSCWHQITEPWSDSIATFNIRITMDPVESALAHTQPQFVLFSIKLYCWIKLLHVKFQRLQCPKFHQKPTKLVFPPRGSFPRETLHNLVNVHQIQYTDTVYEGVCVSRLHFARLLQSWWCEPLNWANTFMQSGWPSCCLPLATWQSAASKRSSFCLTHIRLLLFFLNHSNLYFNVLYVPVEPPQHHLGEISHKSIHGGQPSTHTDRGFERLETGLWFVARLPCWVKLHAVRTWSPCLHQEWKRRCWATLMCPHQLYIKMIGQRESRWMMPPLFLHPWETSVWLCLTKCVPRQPPSPTPRSSKLSVTEQLHNWPFLHLLLKFFDLCTIKQHTVFVFFFVCFFMNIPIQLYPH